MATFPLHTAARGFVGWLRQKVGGVSPDETSRVLTPVVDIAKLYGTVRLYSAFAAGVIPQANWTAGAVFRGVRVPPNARWLVHSIGVATVNGAGMIAPAVFGEQPLDDILPIIAHNSDQRAVGPYVTALGATPVAATAVSFGDPFMLEPGCAVGFVIDGTATAIADVDVRLNVGVTVYPV